MVNINEVSKQASERVAGQWPFELGSLAKKIISDEGLELDADTIDNWLDMYANDKNIDAEISQYDMKELVNTLEQQGAKLQKPLNFRSYTIASKQASNRIAAKKIIIPSVLNIGLMAAFDGMGLTGEVDGDRTILVVPDEKYDVVKGMLLEKNVKFEEASKKKGDMWDRAKRQDYREKMAPLLFRLNWSELTKTQKQEIDDAITRNTQNQASKQASREQQYKVKLKNGEEDYIYAYNDEDAYNRAAEYFGEEKVINVELASKQKAAKQASNRAASEQNNTLFTKIRNSISNKDTSEFEVLDVADTGPHSPDKIFKIKEKSDGTIHYMWCGDWGNGSTCKFTKEKYYNDYINYDWSTATKQSSKKTAALEKPAIEKIVQTSEAIIKECKQNDPNANNIVEYSENITYIARNYHKFDASKQSSKRVAAVDYQGILNEQANKLESEFKLRLVEATNTILTKLTDDSGIEQPISSFTIQSDLVAKIKAKL